MLYTLGLSEILQHQKKKYPTEEELDMLLKQEKQAEAEPLPQHLVSEVKRRYGIDLTEDKPTPTTTPSISVYDEVKRRYGIDLLKEEKDDSIGTQLAEAPSMAVKGLATGALRMAKVIPEMAEFALADVAGIESVKKVTSPMIQSLEKTLHEVAPPAEKIDSMADIRWWAFHLPDAAASIAALLLGGKVSAVAAMAKFGKALSAAKAAGDIKNAAVIANKIRNFALAGTYGAGMAMEAAGARERVRAYEQATGKELGWGQKIAVIAGTGIVAGSLEALAVSKIFDGLAGKTLIDRVLKSMAIEGGTEGAQEIVANAFQKYGYDPKQDLLENVIEAIAIGAAIGAFSGTFSRSIDSPIRKPEVREAIEEEKKVEPVTASAVEQKKILEEEKAKKQQEKMAAAEEKVVTQSGVKVSLKNAFKALKTLRDANIQIPDEHEELVGITSAEELEVAKNILKSHELSTRFPNEYKLVTNTLSAILVKPEEERTQQEQQFVKQALDDEQAPLKHFRSHGVSGKVKVNLEEANSALAVIEEARDQLPADHPEVDKALLEAHPVEYKTVMTALEYIAKKRTGAWTREEKDFLERALLKENSPFKRLIDVLLGPKLKKPAPPTTETTPATEAVTTTAPTDESRIVTEGAYPPTITPEEQARLEKIEKVNKTRRKMGLPEIRLTEEGKIAARGKTPPQPKAKKEAPSLTEDEVDKILRELGVGVVPKGEERLYNLFAGVMRSGKIISVKELKETDAANYHSLDEMIEYLEKRGVRVTGKEEIKPEAPKDYPDLKPEITEEKTIEEKVEETQEEDLEKARQYKSADEFYESEDGFNFVYKTLKGKTLQKIITKVSDKIGNASRDGLWGLDKTKPFYISFYRKGIEGNTLKERPMFLYFSTEKQAQKALEKYKDIANLQKQVAIEFYNKAKAQTVETVTQETKDEAIVEKAEQPAAPEAEKPTVILITKKQAEKELANRPAPPPLPDNITQQMKKENIDEIIPIQNWIADKVKHEEIATMYKYGGGWKYGTFNGKFAFSSGFEGLILQGDPPSGTKSREFHQLDYGLSIPQYERVITPVSVISNPRKIDFLQTMVVFDDGTIASERLVALVLSKFPDAVFKFDKDKASPDDMITIHSKGEVVGLLLAQHDKAGLSQEIVDFASTWNPQARDYPMLVVGKQEAPPYTVPHDIERAMNAFDILRYTYIEDWEAAPVSDGELKRFLEGRNEGWLIGELRGEPAYSNAHFIILGKPPKLHPLSDRQVEFENAIPTDATLPITPKGVMLSSSRKTVVFDDKTTLNERYYSLFVNKFDNVNFKGTGNNKKPILVYSGDKLVGAVMPERHDEQKIIDYISQGKPTTEVVRESTLRFKHPDEPATLPLSSMIESAKKKEGSIKFGEVDNEITVKHSKIKGAGFLEITGNLPEDVKNELIDVGAKAEVSPNRTRIYLPDTTAEEAVLLKLQQLYGNARFESSPNLPDPESTVTLEIGGLQSIYQVFEDWIKGKKKDASKLLAEVNQEITKHIYNDDSVFYRSAYNIDRQIEILRQMARNGELHGYMLQQYNRFIKGYIDKHVLMDNAINFINKNLKDSYVTWWGHLNANKELNEYFKPCMFNIIANQYAVKDLYDNYKAVKFERNSLNLPLPYDKDALMLFYDRLINKETTDKWIIGYLKALEETQYSTIAEMVMNGIPDKAGDISGAWVHFKNVKPTDIDFRDKVTALTVLAQKTPWCTKESAMGQLSVGQFWIFVDDKLNARVAIYATPNGVINEIRGILPNQSVEEQLVGMTEKFVSERLEGGSQFIEELKLKKELVALRESGKKITDNDIKAIARKYHYPYTSGIDVAADSIVIQDSKLKSKVDYGGVNLLDILDIKVDANIKSGDKLHRLLHIFRDINIDNLKEANEININKCSCQLSNLVKARDINVLNDDPYGHDKKLKILDAPNLQTINKLYSIGLNRILTPALKTGHINIVGAEFVDLNSFVGDKENKQYFYITAKEVMLNSFEEQADSIVVGAEKIFAPKLKNADFVYVRGFGIFDALKSIKRKLHCWFGFVYAPNLSTAEELSCWFGNREQVIYAPKLTEAKEIYVKGGDSAVLSLPSLEKAKIEFIPRTLPNGDTEVDMLDIAYLPSLKTIDLHSIDELILYVKHLYINKDLAEEHKISEGIQPTGNRVTIVDNVELDKFVDLEAINKEREGYVLDFLGAQTLYDLTSRAAKRMLRAFGLKPATTQPTPDLPGKEVKEMFDETFEAKTARSKKDFKKFREMLIKGYVDRSGTIRKRLIEAADVLGEEAMINHYKIAGAHSNAIRKIEDGYNDMFGKLSPHMKEVLNRIIQAKRTIQIDEYFSDVTNIKQTWDFVRRFPDFKTNVTYNKKTKKWNVVVTDGEGNRWAETRANDRASALVSAAQRLLSLGFEVRLPDHPRKLMGVNHKEYLKNIRELEGITDEQLNILTKRADVYFNNMKSQLKRLFDAGLISLEVYDSLSNYLYSPRKFFHHLDPEGVSRKGLGDVIKRIEHGSEDLLYNDAEMLYAFVVNQVESRIFINKANLSLYKIAMEIPDNGIVRLARVVRKKADGTLVYETTPPNHHKINVFVDGVQHVLFMPNEYAEQWMMANPILSQSIARMLSVLSGSALLKATATRYNPFFAITNFFRDIAMVWGVTKEYSPILPYAILQIARDIVTVAPDVIRRKGRVIDYLEEGGGMELLTHSRRFTAGKGQLGRLWQQLSNIMGWTGETSELLIRIALRERALKNGKTNEMATWIARSYLDFAQGGQVIKAIDTVIPYLNASIQATRSIVRAARNNPKLFAFKFLQIGLVAALLYLNNRRENPEALDMIPDRVKVNNFVITTNYYYYDRDGEKRYYYFKIPKDQGQKIIATLFEGVLEMQFGGRFPTREFAQSLVDFTNVFPTRLVPPIISAFVGYMGNLDMWTNERIWKGARVVEKEEYKWDTPSLAIAVGQATGLSPARITHATTRVVAQGNPFTGLAGWGLGTILRPLPPEDSDKVMAQMLAEASPVRRFFSSTVPGARLRDPLEEAKVEEFTRRLKQHREFDDLVIKHIKGEIPKFEVTKYMREQPPEDRRRLKTRMENFIKLSNVTNRSWWANLMELPPETRAYVFYSRYLDASDSDRVKLLKELKVAPGVLTNRFLAKLKELDRFEKAIVGL